MRGQAGKVRHEFSPSYYTLNLVRMVLRYGFGEPTSKDECDTQCGFF